MKRVNVCYFFIKRVEKEAFNRYSYFYSLGNNPAGISGSPADGYEEISHPKRLTVNAFNKLLNDAQDVYIGDKKLPEFLEYNGVSLWQFIACQMFEGPLQEQMEFVMYILQLVNKHKITTLVVNGDMSREQYFILKSLPDLYNIRVSFAGVKKLVNTYKKKQARQQLRSLYDRVSSKKIQKEISDRLDDALLSVESARRIPVEKTENTVLLASFPRVWESDGEGNLIDQYYNGFLPFFSSSGLNPLRIELPYYYQIKDDPEKYIQEVKQGRGGVRTIFFHEFLSATDKNRLLPEYYGLYRKYERLLRDKAFNAHFSLGGFSLVSSMKAYWKEMLVYYCLYEVIPAFYSARRLLDHYNPKAVFLLYETGSYSRALLIEAQRKGILNVALQHATIYKEHQYYSHKNQSASADLSKPYFGFVAPNYTLVYSQYFKEMLSEVHHYPPDSLVVVGEWRALNGNPGKLLSNAELLKKRLFDNDKKKIALLLTSIRAGEIAAEMIKTIDPSEYNVLIKFHPADEEIDHIVTIFTDAGFTAKWLFSNLNESILMADVVFAPFSSTTILNCLLLRKKVFPYTKFNYGYTVPWMQVIAKLDDEAAHPSLAEKEEELNSFFEKMGYLKDQPSFFYENLKKLPIGEVA